MSSQPATMAEAAGSVPSPLHRGLPDEIVIWEILVRLPPKALLRCRAVSPAWRRAFLLAHHRRQPSLPVLYEYEFGVPFHQNVLTFDQRAADAQLQRVARFGDCEIISLEASCDGLLVLHDRDRQFSILNPATHQYAPLPQIHGFMVFGMYRHSPTGEYRLLLRKSGDLASYVFTLGSGQPPRHIEYPEAEELKSTPSSVLFRGNLHWYMDHHVTDSASNTIMVFDTTAESFHRMPGPSVTGYPQLFEMGDTLGVASFTSNRTDTIIDIFVLKDYEIQAWAFKCRIELRVDEISMQCQSDHSLKNVLVRHGAGELFVLFKSHECLHHVDINGKIVGSFSFHGRGVDQTQFRLKQTLVPHTLFPSLEGYVVNDSPSI